MVRRASRRDFLMSNVTDRRAARFAVGACALAGLVLVGCSSSDSQRAEHGYYPGRDISPTADSSVGDQAAIKRMMTMTHDTNLRRFNDDLYRAFLLDAPSTMSPKRGIWY